MRNGQIFVWVLVGFVAGVVVGVVGWDAYVKANIRQALAKVAEDFGERGALSGSASSSDGGSYLDKLAERRRAAAGYADPVAGTDWFRNTTKDKITDKEAWMIISSPRFPPEYSGSPLLVIACSENRTRLYVKTADYMGRDNRPVAWRVDDKPALQATWGISTDGQAVGQWSGGQSIPVIKAMLEGEKLTVRVSDYRDVAHTFEFPIKGLDKAIEPIRKHCNW